RIGDVGNALRRTDVSIEAQEARLSELQDEERALSARLQDQRATLGRQLRASYAMGRQEQLKILLNQGDPATLGRALVYYDYLNRSRTERIRAAVEQLQRLQRLRSAIDAERRELEA